MRIITVVGARPQFIKAAAVSRKVREFADVNEIIVHTGQHYDRNMSDIFFEELDIPKPGYHLGIGSGKHGEQTGHMLAEIEKVLLAEKPDWVLLYGDTNSTLAGALAASKLHIPIAHVEAGLRSYNKKMPEEINRILTDHVSTKLFCPTEHSVGNLKTEGIVSGVYNVGDVMFDCMKFYRTRVDPSLPTITKYQVSPGKFSLATIHRAENTDDPTRLKEIWDGLNTISDEMPILIALHPRTKKFIEEYRLRASNNLILIDPLSYREMIELEANAAVILTDSGGVQKEAYFAGTPCITMRGETEWVETVEVGANMLANASAQHMIEAYQKYKGKGFTINMDAQIYGDGHASDKIIQILRGDRS